VKQRNVVAAASWAILALFLDAGRASGQAKSAGGAWQGAIELPGAELGISVSLELMSGAWAGKIDIPAQNARGLRLTEVRVEGTYVSWKLPGVPGDPTFVGTLAADGDAIGGQFSQGGQTYPFKLVRKGEAASVPASAPEPKPAAAEVKPAAAEPKPVPAAATERKPSGDELAGFGDFVRGALKDWKVPGCAVALVKGDKVVLLEGYGLRDMKKNLPVTKDTLFAIGSSTKAFTVMALGILADEGKIAWDKPVREYLPSFRVKDETASEHMTPRDLVTHRSGLPRHDLVWYASPLSRKELVDRLRYLEPNADFREKWQYQNLMFLTAGYLVGEVAHTSWEDFVARRIFAPLSMTASNFSVEDSRKAADFALPYEEKDKQVIEIPFRNITTVGPAGSINSSVTDMAQWVRLHINKGVIGGKRLISENAIADMHHPHMVMFDTSQDPEVVLRSYGMGWFVESYRGKVRVHHGGNIDGFSAMVTFLPAEGVGVVVLTNHGGTPMTEVVARTAIDRLLALPAVDWNARVLARAKAGEAAADKAKNKMDLDRKKGTKPAHTLDEYAGEYEHPAYGTLTVSKDAAGNLKAGLHGISMKLDHWHYETFRASGEDPALEDLKLFFLFETNMKGDVDRVAVPFEPQVSEIVFTKRPPSKLSDPTFLKSLAGVYAFVDNPTVTVTIAVSGGNVLTATVPGQPVYELEPYRGTEFTLKGLTGFSARFVVDEKGAVTELLLVQPNGVFSTKRRS